MKRPLIGLNAGYADGTPDPAGGLPRGERYQAFARYPDAVAEAGGAPVLLPCLPDEAMLAAAVERLDGILFTGGADYPPDLYGEERHPETRVLTPSRRADTDLILARLAFARELPVLGICLGCQLLAIARGGRLIQHLPTAAAHQAGPAGDAYHPVILAPGSWLRAVFGEERVLVNSSHHQAAAEDRPGRALAVTARADDGTIEALEDAAGLPIIGVQWHPERHRDPHHRRRLFEAFVRRCADA